LQHGQARRQKIRDSVQKWKAFVSDNLSLPNEGPAFDAWLEEFLRRSSYVDSITVDTPGMIDEVRGIADACEVKFNEMLGFQLVDEVWANGALSAKVNTQIDR
jgi:hypothetical protein